MIKFFGYDYQNNKITINQPEILLIKEFADLWTDERNKCPEDPSGHDKLKGFKELICIYMEIDWSAPMAKDTPSNRHKVAMEASGLTEEEYNDPIFKAACRKYREIQEKSSLTGQLVETYTNKIHQMKEFVKSIDFDERLESGAPVFKIRDFLNEMQQIEKALDGLKALERKYKEEQEESSGLRGDKKPFLMER